MQWVLPGLSILLAGVFLIFTGALLEERKQASAAYCFLMVLYYSAVAWVTWPY